MASSGYISLNRQIGLLREMDMIANNIANANTTGYRRKGLMFSEFVAPIDHGASVSMAEGNVSVIDTSTGVMAPTGNSLDLAIQGDGFFLVRTPAGDRLTRAGAFSRSASGELVTPDGYSLLDTGGSPIVSPPDSRSIFIAADGTMSADGGPIAQIGLVIPQNPLELANQAGTLFDAPSGVRPAKNATLKQGFLEQSNVSPIHEIARMIEVQRAYELGQSLLEQEDQRLKNVIATLAQQ